MIRHGETDWNSTGRLQGCEDIELNDKGREQAHQLITYLGRENWDVVVSSPLKRAYETAQIIASRLSLNEIEVIEKLRERDYGEASGLLPDERRSRFPEGDIPGQEPFEHLRARAMEALNEVAATFAGKKIIVVAHGALNNSILYTLSGGEYGSFKTRLKNACLNRMVVEEGVWQVKYYNYTVDELMQENTY